MSAIRALAAPSLQMGIYANLAAPVACPTCGRVVDAVWQFYFEDVAQLPDYVIGDTIRWGGDDRGDPTMRDVIAVGYLGSPDQFCVQCSHEHAMVDIAIVDGVIRSVTFRSFDSWIRPTLFVGANRIPR